jgi:hypothetical protein
MKKCSYCGAEYPDDAIKCKIDETRLDKTSFAEEPPVAPTFKRELRPVVPPQSGLTWLSIVSFCFFADGIYKLGWFFYLEYLGYQNEYFLERVLVIGVLSLFIARGLKQRSCVWRTCALALICFLIFENLLHISFFMRHLASNTMAPAHYLFNRGVNILIQLLFYFALTRPNVRKLFYGKPEAAA